MTFPFKDELRYKPTSVWCPESAYLCLNHTLHHIIPIHVPLIIKHLAIASKSVSFTSCWLVLTYRERNDFIQSSKNISPHSDLPSFTHLAWKNRILPVLHAPISHTFFTSSHIFVSVAHHIFLENFRLRQLQFRFTHFTYSNLAAVRIVFTDFQCTKLYSFHNCPLLKLTERLGLSTQNNPRKQRWNANYSILRVEAVPFGIVLGGQTQSLREFQESVILGSGQNVLKTSQISASIFLI